MKDLKSSKQGKDKSPTHQKSQKDPLESLNAEQAAFLQSVQGKSEKELQQEFYRTARKHLAQGTFDEKSILRMIDQLGPIITKEQKERMIAMLRSVKGGD